MGDTKDNDIELGRAPDRTALRELNRTTIRVWEWGDPEAPPVLCIHGAYDHGRMWDGLAPRLVDRGYRVAALDLRGHGDSGRINSGHVYDANIVDMGALLNHIVAESGDIPAGIIGHSFGAAQGFQVAATWPELVRFAVTFDGLGPPPNAFRWRDVTEAASAALAKTMKAARRSARVFPTREAMVEQRSAINTRVPPAWMKHLVQHGSVENEGGFSWKWDPSYPLWIPNGFGAEVVLADFAEVRCPVLAVIGAEDDMWSDMTADEVGRRMALFRDGTEVTVPGAGHYVHLEQPEVAYGHLDAFLDRVEGLR